MRTQGQSPPAWLVGDPDHKRSNGGSNNKCAVGEKHMASPSSLARANGVHRGLVQASKCTWTLKIPLTMGYCLNFMGGIPFFVGSLRVQVDLYRVGEWNPKT